MNWLSHIIQYTFRLFSELGAQTIWLDEPGLTTRSIRRQRATAGSCFNENSSAPMGATSATPWNRTALRKGHPSRLCDPNKPRHYFFISHHAACASVHEV